MAEGIPARLTPREGRRFAFPVGTALLLFAAVSAWRGHQLPPRILAGLGAILLLAGALLPNRLGPVQRAWLGLGRALSKVTTPVFLGLVYFLLITPMALLMRLFGRNPLRHAERNDSFWAPPHSGGRSDLGTQF